jgi:SAM-dependent methyltransferase
MPDTSAADEWAGARGQKWGAQLARMEATLSPIDEPLIGALGLNRPFRIADCGCGGGGTTLHILRRAPAGSVVHGFDISPALIESAQARIPPDQPALAFAVADMAVQPPPPQLYDRLVSRFAVMFYDYPAAAFANLAGWLAPGGRFAFAVWGPPVDNPWITTVRDVVAELVEVPTPEPDAPGPFRYAGPAMLPDLLARAGFDDLEVRDWRGALPIGGGLPAAAAADFALASLSSFNELLDQAGELARDHARARLTQRFSPHEQHGAVRLDARVHIVTGARVK